MELALEIIDIAETIIMACIVVSLIWKSKKEGMLSTVIERILFVVLFALIISEIVLDVLNGGPCEFNILLYAFNILQAVMSIVAIPLLTSDISVKAIERKCDCEYVVVRITEYTNQDEDNETSESKHTD